MITEKQQERMDRAESKAEGLRAGSEEAWGKVHNIVRRIDGQPVLIGHHSEKHHRADLKRIDNASRKGAELGKAADRAEYAAHNSGRAITSDDPEALAALQEELDGLTAEHDRMKSVNKEWKKRGGDRVNYATVIGAMVSDGVMTESEAKHSLFGFSQCADRQPFPSYALTNNGANIRRIKGRIEELKAQAVEEPKTTTGDGWSIEEDVEERRVKVRFTRRLSKEEYQMVRGFGFVWSRTNGAFQRLLNNAGRYAAQEIVKKLGVASDSR